MRVLKTLVNTQYELNIAKTRLDYLLGKKEEIYTKYFPITSKIKDVPVQSSGNKGNDKMALYLAELNDVNEIKNFASIIKDERKNNKTAGEMSDDEFLASIENIKKNKQ